MTKTSTHKQDTTKWPAKAKEIQLQQTKQR